jgi:hypothetical protein
MRLVVHVIVVEDFEVRLDAHQPLLMFGLKEASS